MTRSVAFIGRPDCLELQIDNHASFDKVLSDVTEKLQEGGSQFFVGAASVNVLGHFNAQQRETLASLLHEGYGFSNVVFEGKQQHTTQIETHSSEDRDEVIRTNLSSGASFVRLSDVKSKRGETSEKPLSSMNKQKQSIAEWGVLTQEPAQVNSTVHAVKEGPCLTVSETIRSGQSISFNGDVIVLGDVNIGAEIVATGNIVVVGVLRGVAHAGCSGDPLATVTANSLQPQQLRISEYLALAPEGEGTKSRLFPEQALVDHDRIITRQLGKRSNNK